MDDPEEQQTRAELISRLFALLTAKLEDGAAIAAECQGRMPLEELRKGAADLQDLAGEVATIAAAASALLSDTRASK